MLLPVIMAGGTGSRLWPMSRELYPKQFLRLFGQNSMLRKPSPDSRVLKSMNRWSSVTKSIASWWLNSCAS